MNPNFTKQITYVPNAEETPGLAYIKSFFTYDGKYGRKRWIKGFVRGKLKYIFDAIWLI